MPSDIFFSATLGTGAFVTQDNSHGQDNITRSEFGFSFQVKAGKHWWISDKWGIGLSGGLGSTSSGDSGVDLYGPYKEDFSSMRYVVTISIGIH